MSNVTLASMPPPVRTHVPLVQPPDVQTTPHEPQLSMSLEVSVSQPSEARRLQSAKGIVQESMEHLRASHLGVPWATSGQGVEQSPQWAGLVERSSQLDPQQVCVAGQLRTAPQPTQTLVAVSQNGVGEAHAELRWQPGTHARVARSQC